jgi:hypothetical protein
MAPFLAPSGGSNQERLDATGLARPAVASPAAGEGALDALGDLAGVVLDAMPLPMAIRAVAHAPEATWARAWWAEARPAPAQLLACGEEIVGMLLDRAWPVGTAVSAALEGAVSLEHVELAPGATWTLARVSGGWDVQMMGRARCGAALEVGGCVTGARGDALLGAMAGAGGGLALQVLQGWRIDPVALVAALDLAAPLFSALGATGAPQRVVPLLSARLLPLLRLTQPSRVETRVITGVEAGATVAADASVATEAKMASACALGVVDGVPWFEVALGGAFGARALGPWHAEFAQAGLGGLSEVAASLDTEVRLRVSSEARADGEPAWTYALTRAGAAGEETLEVTTPRALLALLAPRVGLRATSAGRGALPEIALTRDVEVDVPVPSVRGWLGGVAGRAADALPARGVAAGVREARAEARVRVDGLAAVAALDGAGFRGSPTEAELLDAARAVVAHVLGRTMHPARPVDADAGAAWAQVHAEVVTRTSLSAGLGAAGSVPGVEAGGRAGGDLIVEERHPLDDRSAIARVFAA